MKIPLTKKRTLWPLVLFPLLMGAFYILMVYPRFCDRPSFIWEHLFTLSLWIITTVLLMITVKEILIRLHLRLNVLPTVIIPTFSCFLLYIVYISAFIGNFTWGSVLNIFRVFRFLPYLFELADEFDIPRALVAALLLLPLATMVLIFQGRTREMVVWHFVFKDYFELLNFRRKLRLVAFLGLAWLAAWSLVFWANPSNDTTGNFSNDPIVCFFKIKSVPFPMTKERVFWAQKDNKVKKSLKLQKPGVHNIFLFVVDALRADHLPLYGYPRPLTPYLSGFLPSAHSREIELALSNGMETVTGLLSLLTSKEPLAMSHLNYTLPDFLSDQGFKTSLILAGDHHWQLVHKAFGKKIDVFFDGSDHPGPRGICDDELVANEVAQLPEDDGGYHFFYIHLISVHQMGAMEDSYIQYKPVLNFIDPLFFSDPHQPSQETINRIINLYDDRVLQMDGMMRKIMLSLQQKGYLRDYVAVFTGDHGQLLGDKGQYGHGLFASLGGLRVPIIFFGSKPLPSFPENRFAVQMDIAPTLASLAGLDFPSSWQGQSLLKERTNPWSYHLNPTTRPGAEGAVVDYAPGQILKYSRPLDKSVLGPESLYNLTQDPQETNNLINGFDPKLLETLRRQAREHFSTY